MFLKYAAVADVIVLDQRGFSAGATMLQLPTIAPTPLDRPSSVAGYTGVYRAFALALAAANPGHDLAGYDVTQCAADVDELRKALGYPKISLVGTSFGSQWSFAVMRLHPDIVARAVLSGIEPLDHGLDMPSDTFAAMQRIAYEADRASALIPYLPEGGIMAAVRALRDRFARDPVRVSVTDPETGKPVTAVLGREDLQGALHPGGPESWPAFVLSLYMGTTRSGLWRSSRAAGGDRSPASSMGSLTPGSG